MTQEHLEKLPVDLGVREAAKKLGMHHTWLGRQARRKGDPLAPDRARLVNGRLVPMWSMRRIEKLVAQRAERGS